MTDANAIRDAMNAHPRPDEAWLRTRVEDVLEPDVEIIDPHHHVIDAGPTRYLLSETMRDFASGHRVIASVHMQCQTRYRSSGPEALRAVGETEHVRALTEERPVGDRGPIALAAGIVGSIDLALGAGVGATLDGHIEAGGGRFRGVRPTIIWHEDPEIRPLDNIPGILATETARRAIGEVSRRGLTLDLWGLCTQLAEIAEICERFPELQVVVNHAGGPIGIGSYVARHAEMFAAWREGIERIARAPNAMLKFGGLGMRYPGFAFNTLPTAPSSERLRRAWQPYFDPCLDAFGPERCMFESNFPIDRGMFGYRIVWNAFKRLAAGCSPAELRQLCAGSAARAYRLEEIDRD